MDHTNGSGVWWWSHTVVCVFDALCVPGYSTMTAMVYLSSVVPALKDLASHGKTRTGSATAAATVAVETTTTTTTNQYARGVFDIFNNSTIFLVRKQRFRQFYVLGLLMTTVTLYVNATVARDHDDDYAQSVHWWRRITPSQLLLYMHMTRRLYECTFVHQWRTTSVMHVAGWLVGAIHYVWLPLVFVPRRMPSCEPCVRAVYGDRMPAWWYAQYATTTTPRDAVWENDEGSGLSWCVPAIALCLWGQYQQYRHHVLLRNLRTQGVVPVKDKTPTYSLPTAGWFQYVTCPHYLAEIIVYISFAMLLHQERVQGSRHWLVLFWVASNLTLSALINYKWYKENLPAATMNGKKAIFPMLL